LFAKQVLGRPADQTAPLADKLLAFGSRGIDPQAQDLTHMKFDHHPTLGGWPWAEADFAWVEPAPGAGLALRAAGRGDHPPRQGGLRLLLDRAFESGGANYGNRVVLGKPTEPIPGPTSLMLLALQGLTDQPRIDAATGYLRVHSATGTDLEHL